MPSSVTQVTSVCHCSTGALIKYDYHCFNVDQRFFYFREPSTMVSEKSGLLPADTEYAGENGGVSGHEGNLSINQQEAGVTGKYKLKLWVIHSSWWKVRAVVGNYYENM